MKSALSPIAGAVSTELPETRRSTRNKKAPNRLEDEPPATPVISRTTIKRTPGAKTTSKRRVNYTAKHLLTSKASLFTKIELFKMLIDDRAWMVLSAQQKIELLQLLPIAPQHTLETIDCDIPSLAKQVLVGNSAFKSDVTRYQDDLMNGYFDPKWQQKAQLAVQERARGDFDDWKEEETELWWGQKTNVEHSP